MKPRPLFTLLTSLILMSLVLAACSSAPSPTTAPVTTPWRVASRSALLPQPAEPTAVTYRSPHRCSYLPAEAKPVFMTVNLEQVSTWLRNFNPFSPDVRYPAQAGMYEPLLVYNKATGELVPWLATEYTWNEDNTILTFKIRQGVKWSDGQPFSAKDVIFTFDLLEEQSCTGDCSDQY